jgi:glycosyltransferase involved in cell wall biosynthesis
LPTVLWWGRFDPGYSRNRILRRLMGELGWQVADFHPKLSSLADWEARLRRLPKPDLVWVPCFRQRDVKAASRFARSQGVPLVFDPLISAYDKQVDERAKLSAESGRAKRLLNWEHGLFQRADRIIADTSAHADYFADVLGVSRDKLAIVYVGAEETLFTSQPLQPKLPNEPLEVLFYGSFIPLQGPETIIEAAGLYRGPPVKWTLIGQGPLKKTCEEKAKGMNNVTFEDWMPYETLPARIHQADILLGVFGTTPKAGRVIPNKVYQSLACGRALITRLASAYPELLFHQGNSGLVWVDAGDAKSLAMAVAELASDYHKLSTLGKAATETSRQFFSEVAIRKQLNVALHGMVMP